MRCPIFCLSWTPEGRRLITGLKMWPLGPETLLYFFCSWGDCHFLSLRCKQWRVHTLERTHLQLWDNLASSRQSGRQALPTFVSLVDYVEIIIKGADDAVVAQRRVDGDRGPRWLHQVLAEQHEQCQDVPSSQGTSQKSHFQSYRCQVCLLLRWRNSTSCFTQYLCITFTISG